MCPLVGLYVAFTFLNKVIDMKEFCGWCQRPQRTPSLNSAEGKHTGPSKECSNKNWNLWQSLPSPSIFLAQLWQGGGGSLQRLHALIVICCHLSEGVSQKNPSRIILAPDSEYLTPPKNLSNQIQRQLFFSRLNLIAKTPLEDWMWYLTFIWATLGITSSFILQSVTLQWSFPGLQSCPGPLADILAPYARAAPEPGQRQHINNAPQCEFDLVFLLCGSYSPFLGRENMTLVCPQTTFPALSDTTTAHPELPIHCSIMGLSQCFGTCLLQSLLPSVALTLSMYTIHSSLTSLLTGECHGLCVPSHVNLCQMETMQDQLILAGLS